MSIRMTSAPLTVTVIRRKSRARYAHGVRVGDLLELSVDIERSARDFTSSKSGSYAFWFTLRVNGNPLAVLSQNEVPKLEEIFELKEI
jgi:hypothetical protein